MLTKGHSSSYKHDATGKSHDLWYMQVGSRDPKETGGEELMDKFTIMEAATRPHVFPAVQPLEEKIQSGAISPVTKGETSWS